MAVTSTDILGATSSTHNLNAFVTLVITITRSRQEQKRLPKLLVMALTFRGYRSLRILTKSRLLSMPSEIRNYIYREIFRGLEVQLLHQSTNVYSTLVNICRVSRTFLLEARPIFLHTVPVITFADVSPQIKLAPLSLEDRRSIRTMVVAVTKDHSYDYTSLIDFLPNLEQLNIDLTPWCSAFLNIERAMKSKDTVVITGSDAEYDMDKRIGVDRLFATFEDWVRDLAIEHAAGNTANTFRLMVRLDFENSPDDDEEATIVVRGLTQRWTGLC